MIYEHGGLEISSFSRQACCVALWGADGMVWMDTDLHAVACHCANRTSDLRENCRGGQPEERRLHPSHERSV